jgi:hypothetical protein
MFLLTDVAFYVYPANEEDSGDLLLFPVPWHMNVSHSKARPFIVGVGLRPNRSGFVVNPADVHLSLNSTDKFSPARILGPAECGARLASPTWRSFPVEPINLRQGVCTRFAVEFDAATPDPRESFSISVAGVTRDGAAYAMPTVRFRQKRRLDPFGAP